MAFAFAWGWQYEFVCYLRLTVYIILGVFCAQRSVPLPMYNYQPQTSEAGTVPLFWSVHK